MKKKVNKKELASRVAENLREHHIKKSVYIKKHTFCITDEEGNSANFQVKQRNKDVLYTVEDTEKIIDACLSVITAALKNGEEINIYGFGNLGLRHRAAKKMLEPNSGEWYDIEAHYVPKFSCGTDLKLAARLYALSLADTALEGAEDDGN